MMMAKSRLQINMRYKWVRLTLIKPLKRLFSEVRSLAHRSLATFCDSGQQRDPWCPSRDYDATFGCRDFIMTTQTKLDLEKFGGFDPEVNPIDDLLSQFNPIDSYRDECTILTKLFGLQSEVNVLEKA
jgi:hypothetical protein